MANQIVQNKLQKTQSFYLSIHKINRPRGFEPASGDSRNARELPSQPSCWPSWACWRAIEANCRILFGPCLSALVLRHLQLGAYCPGELSAGPVDRHPLTGACSERFFPLVRTELGKVLALSYGILIRLS